MSWQIWSLSNKILDNLSALESLKIRCCDGLESLLEKGLRNLNSLEVLLIKFCGRLNCLAINVLCGLSQISFSSYRDWLQPIRLFGKIICIIFLFLVFLFLVNCMNETAWILSYYYLVLVILHNTVCFSCFTSHKYFHFEDNCT